MCFKTVAVLFTCVRVKLSEIPKYNKGELQKSGEINLTDEEADEENFVPFLTMVK